MRIKFSLSISDKCNADAELLSVTQDRGVIPRTMLEGRVMSPEGSTDSYKLIKEGDFAISLRSFQGGIEYSRYQGLISPAYTVLRPKLKIHYDFYRHFFKSYLYREVSEHCRNRHSGRQANKYSRLYDREDSLSSLRNARVYR